MNHAKGLQRIIYLSCATIVLLLVWHYTQGAKRTREEMVLSEDVKCITAICLDSSGAERCAELEPTMSLITYVEGHNGGGVRIIVKPSDKSCGRPR